MPPGLASQGGARSGMAASKQQPRRRARRRGSPTEPYRLPRADFARQRTRQVMTSAPGAIAPRLDLTFRSAMLRPPQVGWSTAENGSGVADAVRARTFRAEAPTWRRGGAGLSKRGANYCPGDASDRRVSKHIQPKATKRQKTHKQPKWKTAHNWHDGPGQASRPPEVSPLGQA